MTKLTKIVATIGNKSCQENQIRELIQNGANVFRLNFSHGDHEWHRQASNTIRQVAAEFDQGIAILQDLAGPKIRTGDFTDELTTLVRGSEFKLTTKEIVGDNTIVSVNYSQLIEQAEAGQILRLDDGKLRLDVISKTDDTITTQVIEGGEIRSRRGINVPGLALDIDVLTDKDRNDLDYWPDGAPDWVSLSFVQTADDIHELKSLLQQKGQNSKVIAKIETAEAVKNIDTIITASDGIMIARGDLAAETPLTEVPALQHRIIAECRCDGKPVIVATQMMESMMHNPTPTRAEVTDVANAIFDGTDAVMLSGETAAGDNPTRVVSTMRQVAEAAESADLYDKRTKLDLEPRNKAESAAASIVAFAQSQSAKAIVNVTQSGKMSLSVARLRPGLPIIAITTHATVGRQLALSHGVWSRLVDDLPDDDAGLREWLPKFLVEHTHLQSGDAVLASYGQEVHESGSTDTITLITI